MKPHTRNLTALATAVALVGTSATAGLASQTVNLESPDAVVSAAVLEGEVVEPAAEEDAVEMDGDASELEDFDATVQDGVAADAQDHDAEEASDAPAVAPELDADGDELEASAADGDALADESTVPGGNAGAASSISASNAVSVDAETNLVPDPMLQKCMNETVFKRDATTPITMADFDGMDQNKLVSLTCNAELYPGITNLEGIQHGRFGRVHLDGLTLSENLFAPLNESEHIWELVFQMHNGGVDVLDLSQISDLGDQLTQLTISGGGDFVNSDNDFKIVGLEHMTALTKLTLNYEHLTSLEGIESLGNLKSLYVVHNELGNDVDLTSLNLDLLNISGNRINDFSNLGAVTTLRASDQRYVSDEEILVSADETGDVAVTLTDRVVPYTGTTVEIVDGDTVTPETGEFVFSDEDVVFVQDMAELGFDVSDAPSNYNFYMPYGWQLNDGSRLVSAKSASAHPVVLVDMEDNDALTAKVGDETGLEFVEFVYDADPQNAGFDAVDFQVTEGALPEGLTLDSASGKLVGVPTVAGTSNFVVTATNEEGMEVVGEFTVTVADVEVPTDPTDPTDPEIPVPVPTDPAGPGVTPVPENPAKPTAPSEPVSAKTDLAKTGADAGVALLAALTILGGIGLTVGARARKRNS